MSSRPPSSRTPFGPVPTGTSDSPRPTTRRKLVIAGRYEVTKELGKGSMGVVYLARQTNLNRPVAIKTLKKDAADEIAIKRFRQEAEMMARLRHPGIVTVFDVGEHNGMPFFAMDFIKGKALSEIARERPPLPQRRVLEIMRDVARALQHAHEHGVIHRDLKPSNVLVTEEGDPVLTDFGLAADTLSPAHLTQTGFVVGTPLYMSPEQASGRGPVDGKSDVYSLGLVAYEVLTGANPLDVGSVGTVMNRAARGGVPAPSTVDPGIEKEIDRLVLKACARDRAKRFADAEDLAKECERVLRTLKADESSRSQARPAFVESSEPMASPLALARGRTGSSAVEATEPYGHLPVEDEVGTAAPRAGRGSTRPSDRLRRRRSDRAFAQRRTTAGREISDEARRLALTVAGVVALLGLATAGVAWAFMTGFARERGPGVASAAGAATGSSAPTDPAVAPEGPAPRGRPIRHTPADPDIRNMIERARVALSDPARLRDAREIAQRAVARDPEWGAARAVLAIAHARLDEPKEAERAWEEAIAIDPMLLFEHLPTSLDRENGPGDALVRRLFAAVEAGADPIAARMAVAVKAGRRGAEQDAADAVTELTTLVLEEERARLERARWLWRRGRWEEALRDLDEVIRQDPTDGLAVLLRARYRRERRRWTEATEDARRARELAPHLPGPLIEQGKLALERLELDDARALFDQARRIAPDSAAPLVGLCQVALRRLLLSLLEPRINLNAALAQFRDLERQGEAARQREPARAVCEAIGGWEELLKYHVGRGDLEQALGRYRRAVAFDRREDEVHRLHVNAQAYKGDVSAYHDAVRAWLEVTPDRVGALIEAGEAACRSQRLSYDEARAYFQEARELAPGDTAARLRHAFALVVAMRTGGAGARELDEMLAELERARGLDATLYDSYLRASGLDAQLFTRAPAGGATEQPPPPLAGGDSGGAAAGPGEVDPRRLEVIRAKQPLLAEADRVLRRDVRRGLALLREAAELEPRAPLPYIHLIQLYVGENAEVIARAMQTDVPALHRQALADAESAVQAARALFPEWEPLALAFRAHTEMLNGRREQARTTVAEARRRLAGDIPGPDRDVLREAGILLDQVEAAMERLERERQGR